MANSLKGILKGFITIAILAVAGFAIWKIATTKIKGTDSPAETKHKYNLTCSRIVTITIALDEAFEEVIEVPDAKLAVELKTLVERYTQDAIFKDAWGNDLLFQFGDGPEFYVASPGSDGRFEGFDNQGQYTECAGQDIIARRGTWKLSPLNTPWDTRVSN